MCKSRAEGGQRCHGHAIKALSKALAHHAKWYPKNPDSNDATVSALDVRDRLVDVASTPQGQDALARIGSGAPATTPEDEAIEQALKLAAARSQYGTDHLDTHARLITQEGNLIAERNRKVAQASKADRRKAALTRFKERATAIAVTVTSGFMGASWVSGTGQVFHSAISVSNMAEGAAVLGLIAAASTSMILHFKHRDADIASREDIARSALRDDRAGRLQARANPASA